MPKVSVCMASYNHDKYVRASIESVLTQSYQDFEILVTDDASQDRTVAEVQAVSDKRLSVTVMPQNRGACVAMNTSIRKARGEYVAVLNSDDVFLPGKLEAQARFLDQHPNVAAVFARPRFIGEDGGPYSGREQKDRILRNITNRTRPEWLRHFFLYGNALCHPTVMIRRRCYEEVGLYNPALAQLPDLEMWVRLLRIHEIHLLDDEFVGFRIRDNNMNASASRPDVLVRDQWEWRKVLDQYLRLDDELLCMTFPELARYAAHRPPPTSSQVPSVRSHELPLSWHLAELALQVGRPAHVLFALDTMYGALPAIGDESLYREFIAYTGSFDPYAVLHGMPARRQIRKIDGPG